MRLTTVLSTLLMAVLPNVALAQQIGQCFDLGTYRFRDATVEQQFQTGMASFERKQYQAAKPYLESAAEKGHARAQELVGQLYVFGFGVPENPGHGYRYLNAAAAQGHRGAMGDLGFFFSQMHVDLKEADRYFLAAAQCGNLEAQVELGLNYEFGRGVPRDRRQAIYWLSQAARTGGRRRTSRNGCRIQARHNSTAPKSWVDISVRRSRSRSS